MFTDAPEDLLIDLLSGSPDTVTLDPEDASATTEDVAVIDVLEPLEASISAASHTSPFARSDEPEEVSDLTLVHVPDKLTEEPELVSMMRSPAEISVSFTLEPEEVSISAFSPDNPVPVTRDPEDVSTLEMAGAETVTRYFSLLDL